VDIDEARRQHPTAAVADVPRRLPGQVAQGLDAPSRDGDAEHTEGVTDRQIVPASDIRLPLSEAF